MQLRRFLGDNTPAALNAVREALGDDAIILANRRVGGRVEIIATGQIDDDAIAVASATEEGSGAAAGDESDDDGISVQLSKAAIAHSGASSDAAPEQPSPAGTDPVSSRRHPAFRDIHSVAPVGEAGAKAEAGAGVEVGTDAPGPQSRDTNAAGEDQKADGVSVARDGPELDDASTADNGTDTPRASPVSVNTDAAANRLAMQPLCALLEQHLETQKALLEKRFQQQDTKLWGELDPQRSTNFKRLLRLGLGASLAAELVEAVPDGLDLDSSTRRALSLLKARLPIGTDTTFTEPGITVLSGPAGGGKSTVLMKLAAEHVRRHERQSLVMICADNRRIGAFESLQACARLLGVPAVHARNDTELADRIDALSQKTLVLVDHTLATEPESLAITALPALERGARALRRLLVLPATLQAATAEAIVANEADAADNCVLTQLDKSARLGEVFNALIRHRLPIAWWSDNAHIQQPMQKADASILVASAVAMGRRVPTTGDDELLMGLIQPNRTIAGVRGGSPISDLAAQEFSEEASRIARQAANTHNERTMADRLAASDSVASRVPPVATFSDELAGIVNTPAKRQTEGLAEGLAERRTDRPAERAVVSSRIRSGLGVGRRKAGRNLT